MPRTIQVDSRDEKWPRPMRDLSFAYKKAHKSDLIELLSTECAIEAGARDWCERTGNRFLKFEHDSSGIFVIEIEVVSRKGRHRRNLDAKRDTRFGAAVFGEVRGH